ncbi:MAG: hypothetical protein RRA15_08040 [bacterium]|nr:hypothetical protein [bacterium]
MAIREEMRQGFHRFSSGSKGKHWAHENGMYGWTRSWHGYPCLHWSEVGCMPRFDARQELDLLRVEAGELAIMLGQIRKRTREIEAELK